MGKTMGKVSLAGLNDYLRNGTVMSTEQVDELKSAIISGLHTDIFGQYSGKLYRGMIVSYESMQLLGFDPNKVVTGTQNTAQSTYYTKNGYSSWSKNPKIAKAFAKPESAGGYGVYSGQKRTVKRFGIVMETDASDLLCADLEQWYNTVDAQNSNEQEVLTLEDAVPINRIVCVWNEDDM